MVVQLGADVLVALEERDGGAVRLLFRPDGEWSPMTAGRALVAALAAVEAANEEAGQDEAEGGNVDPTPSGVAIQLDPTGWPDVTADWLAVLTGRLTEVGLSGTIGIAPQADRPGWLGARLAAPALTAFLAVRQDRPRGADPGDQHLPPRWAVSPERGARLCRDLTGWATRGADREVLLTQGTADLVVRAADAPPWLEYALDQSGRAGVLAADETATARRVFLSWWGQVVLQLDDPRGWRERLGDLTAVLRDEAAQLDAGFVRLAPGYTLNWTNLASGNPELPGITEADVRDHRALWARYLPDAHGVQLLTDAHLAGIGDLADWLVEPVAPGRHLVSARDLAPWYAGSGPDPAAVAKARQDFAGALLRPEVIAAERR